MHHVLWIINHLHSLHCFSSDQLGAEKILEQDLRRRITHNIEPCGLSRYLNASAYRDIVNFRRGELTKYATVVQSLENDFVDSNTWQPNAEMMNKWRI
jgi:hypothetical protein